MVVELALCPGVLGDSGAGHKTLSNDPEAVMTWTVTALSGPAATVWIATAPQTAST